MEEDEITYSPYCELCEACGEDGCCSHIICFSNLIKNPKCKYGEIYVKEAILNKNIVKVLFELLDTLENDDKYTKKQFLTDLNYKIDLLYDERFDIK